MASLYVCSTVKQCGPVITLAVFSRIRTIIKYSISPTRSRYSAPLSISRGICSPENWEKTPLCSFSLWVHTLNFRFLSFVCFVQYSVVFESDIIYIYAVALWTADRQVVRPRLKSTYGNIHRIPYQFKKWKENDTDLLYILYIFWEIKLSSHSKIK